MARLCCRAPSPSLSGMPPTSSRRSRLLLSWNPPRLLAHDPIFDSFPCPCTSRLPACPACPPACPPACLPACLLTNNRRRLARWPRRRRLPTSWSKCGCAWSARTLCAHRWVGGRVTRGQGGAGRVGCGLWIGCLRHASCWTAGPPWHACPTPLLPCLCPAQRPAPAPPSAHPCHLLCLACSAPAPAPAPAQILSKKVSPKAFSTPVGAKKGENTGEIGIEGTAIEEAEEVGRSCWGVLGRLVGGWELSVCVREVGWVGATKARGIGMEGRQSLRAGGGGAGGRVGAAPPQQGCCACVGRQAPRLPGVPQQSHRVRHMLCLLCVLCVLCARCACCDCCAGHPWPGGAEAALLLPHGALPPARGQPPGDLPLLQVRRRVPGLLRVLSVECRLGAER